MTSLLCPLHTGGTNDHAVAHQLYIAALLTGTSKALGVQMNTPLRNNDVDAPPDRTISCGQRKKHDENTYPHTATTSWLQLDVLRQENAQSLQTNMNGSKAIYHQEYITR